MNRACKEEVSKVANSCKHRVRMRFGMKRRQQPEANRTPASELTRRTRAKRRNGKGSLPACGDMKVYQRATD